MKLKEKALLCILLISVLFVSSCGQDITHATSTPTDVNARTSTEWIPAHDEPISFDKGVCSGILDSEGMLWFASRGRGIYSFNGTSFRNFTIDDGLSDNNITSVFEDKAGVLWFGTPNGLCRYDGSEFTDIPIPYSDTSSTWLDKVYPIVNPNQVMSMHQDRHGDYWIGTNGAGVYQYDGTTFIQHLDLVGMVYEDGLQHNIVLGITEDHSGILWFTSLSHAGVMSYNGTEFTEYQEEDGLSDDFIRSIYCDSDGHIWIGTHGNHDGGLDRFDGKTFTNFHEEDGLCSNNVQCMHQDQSGNLWLGSGIGNLCVYDGSKFLEFRSKAGQVFPIIQCIVEDLDGNIWFGGKDGLWKFDGTDVVDIAKQ